MCMSGRTMPVSRPLPDGQESRRYVVRRDEEPGPTAARAARAQELEAGPAEDRHVDLHQLRHVHPALPAAVRCDLQPRHGRDHHPRAVLRAARSASTRARSTASCPIPTGRRLPTSGGPPKQRTTRMSDVSRSWPPAPNPGRRRAGGPDGGAGAARLHRVPALDAGRGRGLRRRPASPSSCPALPGHGTTVEDMLDHQLGRLVRRRRRGHLPGPRRARPTRSSSPACRWAARSRRWLAARPSRDRRHRVHQRRGRRPAPEMLELVGRHDRGAGETSCPASARTSPSPTSSRSAYDLTPLAAVWSLIGPRPTSFSRSSATSRMPGADHDQRRRPRRRPRPTATTSRRRSVVRSSASCLERSYHVATLDHDKDRINEAEAVAFARRVC